MITFEMYGFRAEQKRLVVQIGKHVARALIERCGSVVRLSEVRGRRVLIVADG